MRPMDKDKRQKHNRRIAGLSSKRELRLSPGFQSHEALWAGAKTLPTDFEPYGKRKRSDGAIQGDCSSNCRRFHVLGGTRGMDWGVCANQKSPRAGLLTFEHMGCPQYEWDKRVDFLETASGKKMMERYEKAEQVLQQWRGRKRVVERESSTEDVRRDRSDFKDRIENLLNDALFSYAKLKTAQANDPLKLGVASRAYDPLPPKYDYWVWYWDNELDRLIDLLLGHYLEKKTNFDRRKTTEEVILEINRDTVEYWQHAPKSVGRALKCDVSAVCVPDAPNREGEFWARVDNVIRKALESKRGQ
jgi:hypothetical protein